ncbi:vacuolar protein sorting-associated protein 13 family protein, partial [Trypanosoma theileri]
MERDIFTWSDPVKLVTLSSSNVPIAMKHYVQERTTNSDGSSLSSVLLKMGVAVFTSMRIPLRTLDKPIREDFACLSITPWRQNGQFIVDFDLNSNIPVVVENRTKRSLQYEQIYKSSLDSKRIFHSYIVEPFTDGVTCFEGEDATPMIRLTLFGGNESSQSCIIDLVKDASKREAVKVSKDMFVLCTYDYNLQRYYISVTTDRSLESTLLFQ